MKLFGRSQGSTVEAIVHDAAPPPQSLIAAHYGDWVWVVADLGSGPVNIRSVVPLPKDRWLLPGMKVSITVNVEHLEKVSAFDVDFDQVPKITELVAANDPLVADPRAARASARAARDGASTPVGAPTGLWSKLMSQAWIGDNFAESYSPRPHLDTSSWSAEFDRETSAVASKPAASGTARGVAILTALRMDMRSISHNWDGTPTLDRENPGPQRALRGINAVLTVSVPGRAPFAVFVEHFKPPRAKPADLDPTLYPWLPVQVSLTDPMTVEVVWDEVPDRMDKLGSLFQQQVDDHIAQVQQIQEAAGVVQAELPSDLPAGEQAAQQLTNLSTAPNLPPEVAAMMQKATKNLAGANKHLPPQLQGAMNDAMRLAAQQMANANQGMANPHAVPGVATPSPEQAHQMAINAASSMAPVIAAQPKAIQKMRLDGMRAGLDLMPPETRDACLEIYRKAGIDI